MQLVNSAVYQQAKEDAHLEHLNMNFSRLVALAVPVPKHLQAAYGGAEYITRLPINQLPGLEGLCLVTSPTPKVKGNEQLLASARNFLAPLPPLPGQSEDEALLCNWARCTDPLSSMPHGDTMDRVLQGVHGLV